MRQRIAGKGFLMGVAYDEAVRVSICTASDEMAERLGIMLLRWARGECVAMSAERTDSASLFEDGIAGLMFLDIDSVDLPEKAPTRKENVGLIVISRDAGKVIRSYRWHPAAFLKPDFDQRRLEDALNACEKRWTRGRLGLESPYRRRDFRLPLGRIRYVEASAHYCMFNQGRQTVRLRVAIDELEKLLPCPPFARCHRSYIVHLGAVDSMTYTAVNLRSGAKLPLGRVYVNLFKTAWQAWQRGETSNDDIRAYL